GRSGWPSAARGGAHVPFTAAAVFAFCAAVVWPAAGTVASSSAAIDVKMRFFIGHLPRSDTSRVQSTHAEVNDCGGHGQRTSRSRDSPEHAEKRIPALIG